MMVTPKVPDALRYDRDHNGVLHALSKARAMAYVLEQAGAPDGMNDLVQTVLAGKRVPEHTREWLHTVVAEALHAALDSAEVHWEAAVLRLHRRLSEAGVLEMLRHPRERHAGHEG